MQDDLFCYALSNTQADAVLDQAAAYTAAQKRGLFPLGLPNGVVIVITTEDKHDYMMATAGLLAWGISEDCNEHGVALADRTLGVYNFHSRAIFAELNPSTISHELTHALKAADFGYTDPGPVWFDEGLAELFSANGAPEVALAPFPYADLRDVEGRLEAGTLLALTDLFSRPRESFDSACYRQACLFVRWLWEQGQVPRLLEVLRNLAPGHRTSENFLRAAGLEGESLQAHWHAWIRDRRAKIEGEVTAEAGAWLDRNPAALWTAAVVWLVLTSTFSYFVLGRAVGWIVVRLYHLVRPATTAAEGSSTGALAKDGVP